MGTTEQPVMPSPLADVRDAPLANVPAAGLLDRLRPADKAKVAVAAFNASL